MSVKISEKEYKSYGKCVFIENDSCALAVTVEFGPRVIYFALNGRENVMLEDEDSLLMLRATAPGATEAVTDFG